MGLYWQPSFSAALTARNVTDEPPPRIQYSVGLISQNGFDPANADPIGRYVSLQLSKKIW